MSQAADDERIQSRAELLPEEQAAGSDDPVAQATQILEESDERTDGMVTTREVLLGCLSVPRWADDVLAGQPYEDRDALLTAADKAAGELSDAELEQALSGHPRIGERGDAQSQQEQAGVDPAATDAAERLAAGNAAYEERFDRVFLIRAAGRDAEEILAELDRRLGNDDETERAEVVDSLRQIALLRLEEALS